MKFLPAQKMVVVKNIWRSDQEDLDHGEVVSVGGGVTGLLPGNKIAFLKNSAWSIVVDGEPLAVVPHEDIFGIFSE